MKKTYGRCVTDRYYEGFITINKVYELIPHEISSGVYIIDDAGKMHGILKDRFVVIRDSKLSNIKIV